LQKRKVKKIYRAITENLPTVGRYEHHLLIDTLPPKPVSSAATEGSVNAILNILEVWSVPEGFACEIELETGRTHQIRAQFAFLGHPILGDDIYGKKTVHERLALECYHISFAHRSRTIGISRPTPLVGPSSPKGS
jgi:23S rRNA pseudouridine1911/1915/1917 synthase